MSNSENEIDKLKKDQIINILNFQTDRVRILECQDANLGDVYPDQSCYIEIDGVRTKYHVCKKCPENSGKRIFTGKFANHLKLYLKLDKILLI